MIRERTSMVMENDNDLNFKMLVKNDADWYLKFFKPPYPITTSQEPPCQIISVVREVV